jgi:metallo-beta-lactamase class B
VNGSVIPETRKSESKAALRAALQGASRKTLQGSLAYDSGMRIIRAAAALITCLFLLGIGTPVTSTTAQQKSDAFVPPTALELAIEPMAPIGDSVWVAKIGEGLWVFTATGAISSGAVFPANGMLLETKTGSVVVDPGWTAAQSKALMRWARETLHRPVAKAVVTHSHSDRMGGIEPLAEAGIPVLALGRTRELAQKAGHTILPIAVAELETKPYRDPDGFELYFPGAGHTPDNIVVNFPAHFLVFGGCLVKSVTSADLGNLADAVMTEYPGSIERVMRAYPKRRIVVPGHGSIAGDPLAHTLKLLRDLGAATPPARER